MSTYNYCCLENDDCPIRGKTVQIQAEEDEVVECPECGGLMKRLGVVMHGGLLKFASMTKEQQKVVLKKRSKEHAQKVNKDKKIEMIRNLDRGFKNM